MDVACISQLFARDYKVFARLLPKDGRVPKGRRPFASPIAMGEIPMYRKTQEMVRNLRLGFPLISLFTDAFYHYQELFLHKKGVFPTGETPFVYVYQKISF